MSGSARPLTILCAGAYGIRNAGDDLPLAALAGRMQELLPSREVRFRALSRHPDPWDTANLGAVMIPNLEHETREAARGRWFLGMNPDDDPEDFHRVRREIQKCDLLVLGAGNALLDHTIGVLRGPVPLMALYGSLARLHDRPVMLYGMSVGPLRTEWGRDLSRRLIADAKVVTVRDRPSAMLCDELLGRPGGAVHLPDATLAAELPPAGRGREVLATEGLEIPVDRPVIAFGLRDLVRPLGENFGRRQEEAVLKVMTRLKDDAAFLFVPQSTYPEDDDRHLAARLAANAPPDCRCLVIRERHHPADLIALYGVANVTLASRLHAAVFSAMASTPCVALDYLPKVGGFMDQLEGCGSILSVRDLEADDLLDALNRLIEDGEPLRKRLRARVDIMRGEALEYARLAVTEGLSLAVQEGTA